MHRETLKNAGRIVVKLGTGILTDSHKHPDLVRMAQLVSQVAALRQSGHEVVLVSSGAVGAGMGVLGYDKRPAGLSEKQACAAIGQSRLMSTYEKLFSSHDLNVAQVLLTHDDLEHHERHLNARNTLVTLLRHGVVPIINENDAVSITELKFGDNDRLSALVASLMPVDLLIILTTVDGLIENYGTSAARTISVIESLTPAIERMARVTDSPTAVGGMSSKLLAAKIAIRSGIPLIIAPGLQKNILPRILAGEDIGTLFIPKPTRMNSRKRWIAFFHHPKGALFVDDGARTALIGKGKSLLFPGITRCEGEFASGDVVRICDDNGTEFARGICGFDSTQLQTRQAHEVVVHRDNLVIL
jgi:glutamate 5-kinase